MLASIIVTTMGTATTGPDYVPAQWLKHCGFPGWTIPMIDNFLPQAFASNAAKPDLITIHLGSACNPSPPAQQDRRTLGWPSALS